jgi:hypothetical protein
MDVKFERIHFRKLRGRPQIKAAGSGPTVGHGLMEKLTLNDRLRFKSS